MLSRISEVNLVRSNAKTADDNQVFRLSKDALSKLGLRADADDMNVPVASVSSQMGSAFW